MGDGHRREEQGAAGEHQQGYGFVEDEPASGEGEDAFHGEDDGGRGGGDVPLRPALQEEGDAGGGDGGVEDVPFAVVEQRRVGERARAFCGEGGGQGEECGDGDLYGGECEQFAAAHGDAVVVDVERPDEGAGEGGAVARVPVERGAVAVDGGKAGEAGEGEQGGEDECFAEALAAEEGEERHEDDVEAGDEAGFACGSVLQSPLLAVHAEKEEYAAADAVAQPVSPGGAAAQSEDGEEEGGRDGQSPAHEGKRADGGGAVALEDEGDAKECRGKE